MANLRANRASRPANSLGIKQKEKTPAPQETREQAGNRRRKDPPVNPAGHGEIRGLTR